MKICPRCDREYTDDTLNFCLMCGTPLTDAHAHPTVVIGTDETVTRQVAPTGQAIRSTATAEPLRTRKSRTRWIVFGLAVAAIIVASSAVMLTTFLWSNKGGSSTNVSRGGTPAKTVRPTAKPATLRPTPTAESAPGADDDKTGTSKPDTSDISEPTPIVWTTSAVTFGGEPGRVIAFECPADGEAGAVWGSDVYSADSSICTAAVHAGKITLEDGGPVTIEYRPGRALYGATTRNGITTNTYGEYPSSFIIKDN